MKTSHVLGSITAAIWVFFVWKGYSSLKYLDGQHVPGYPSSGQVNFYFHFPIVVLLIVLIALAASRYRMLKIPAVLLYTLSLLAVLPYLLGYTGGV
ncbi:hypothetical protein [Dyella humicola]|uniref:hypothetical protein n=1 Tax=Dyella humicola TaxID=2992126 RepID=UPI002254E997|nr:hypothetical protein [Dyella humicola]